MTPASIELAATGGAERAFSGRAQRSRQWARLVKRYQYLARREMLACAVILALTLGIRAALLPWMPVPHPAIHDEFSYLLAADTYAHGRLTNPPHPFWQHFETFQELSQPTYASKYQPLQGLVLAVGQKVFHEPWAGVYLSTGLMCMSLCWMLQGWIAPEAALVGALCAVLRVGVLSYWMNSYLAGSVPAIGGTLAMGAVARIWRSRQFGHSITWAAGLSMLALSRPYDAAIVGCGTAALLLWLLRKAQTPIATFWGRVALPASMVLLPCAGFIAYNDDRVTGRASTLPYQVHDRQYAMASMFTPMPLGPEPPYRHAIMREFWAEWNVGQWTKARTDPVSTMLVKSLTMSDFYFPFWAWSIPLLLWPYCLTSGAERATVFLLAVFTLMMAPLIAIQPHYGAAFAGVLYLRFLQSVKRLWSWRPGSVPLGRALASLVVALALADGLGLVPGRDLVSRGFGLRASGFGAARAAMMQSLTAQPGRQLVLVRYAPEHDPQNEWVYNRAAIDASRVVWAREMSPEQDGPFLEYFRGRRVWLLEADRSPPQLTPYTPERQP